MYLLAGWVWVAAGDWILAASMGQEGRLTLAQMTKGFIFVLASALILYFSLRWWSRHLDAVHARLDLVLRQIPGLLWTTDPDLGLRSLAGTALRTLDLRQARPGLPVTELVEGEERRAEVEGAHRRALAGQPSDYQVDIGGRHYVVRVEPLRVRDRVVGCASFALDVTGLRLPAISRGVRDALERSQVLATVGTVVLEVGHQLMNPLFAMSSALDALEARMGDDPRTERHRELLREQVERATNLVRSLQDYGRLGELSPEHCDVAELMLHLEERWVEEARRLGAELVVEAPPVGKLEAFLDPQLVGLALGHLVENGLQYTAPGTCVRVRARQPPEGSSDLLITVEDEGGGFFAGDLERAKSPLISRRPAGTGLGLAIADRIVLLHGGRLNLGVGSAGGALVSVTLPLHGPG